MNRRMMTVQDVCRHLGVSEKIVRALRRTGVLPMAKNGKRYMAMPADVERVAAWSVGKNLTNPDTVAYWAKKTPLVR